MAKRPVFIPDGRGFVDEPFVTFKWYPGFALRQKQRSIRSLHEAAGNELGLRRILEVSTKSEVGGECSGDELGRQLSAFGLRTKLPDGYDTCLEAAFQGSKVFADVAGGRQLTELYTNQDGRDVKRIMRRWKNTPLRQFRFGAGEQGEDWPLEPKSAFYDWLYIRALREHPRYSEIRRRLREYDGFTDIEFNPRTSLNCQARACALLVVLDRQSALEDTETRDGFLRLLEELNANRDDMELAACRSGML